MSRNTGRNRRSQQRRDELNAEIAEGQAVTVKRIAALRDRLCPEVAVTSPLPDTASAEEQLLASVRLLNTILEGALAELDRRGITAPLPEAA